MVHPIIFGVGTYVAAELYERAPLEFKQWVKKTFKIHHGTAGVIGGTIGVATGNLPLISGSAGLILHDHKDAPEWPKDLQIIIDSISKKINDILNSENKSTIRISRF